MLTAREPFHVVLNSALLEQNVKEPIKIIHRTHCETLIFYQSYLDDDSLLLYEN